MTVHGDQDQTVDYQSAVDIAAQADAVGVPYTFYTDVGGGHSVGVDRTVNGVTIMDLTLNFIEAILSAVHRSMKRQMWTSF